MRKFYLTITALFSLLATGVQAQTILEEDFETGTTQSAKSPLAKGEGWTTVNSYSGANYSYNWFNYYSDPESAGGPTISGGHCAACDGPITSSGTVDGAGPREEILLSPELDLNDTYQLQFSWKVSPMNAMDNSRYDLQVRVVEDGNLQGAETVFSIQNEQMLRESGVSTFPIGTWELHTSKIDLSDWKGQKVKLAFVYKMLTDIANIVWLDDITVKKFTPATGPVAQVSLDRFDFKDVYIGEKFYTDVITLTNTGKNGLKITGMDLPQGIETTLDASKVELKTYEAVDFQLSYSASMTTPAQGNAVIHTTGGDITIAFSATKQLVPEGYQLETFNDYFPPAGWRNTGWGQTARAIEGDGSAYCSGSFSDCYLRSPRLDLSDGGKLIFTYYDEFDEDDGPYNDMQLQVSYDGGDSWTTKWIRDWETEVNQLITVTVDLGMGSEESYVRWVYPQVESDDDGAYPHSNFTLDRVLLPNVYGADGLPLNATIISPANNATNVYPRDIVLQWGPAQFAAGYKVYVGSDANVSNLVEGYDVGNALTYTIPVADYETTYRWKIVAYNAKGNSVTASTWRFTTQKDASVLEFPYTENFDEGIIPDGWLSTTTAEWNNRRWEPNQISAYGGKGYSLYTTWMYAGNSSTLLSPEFALPAGGEGMSISFDWGDEHPRSLLIDETGLLKKQNVEGGNGASDVVFEILADGEWKQASYLSEKYNADGDTKYWRHEKIDLTEYAGKRVQFRWVNHSYSGAHNGASLDNVVIDGNVADYVEFNRQGWDAGQVNYDKGATSGEQFTMINRGKNNLKVKAVTFATDNFASSIAAGQEIATGEGITFSLQFYAKDVVKQVTDEMTVEFESGYKATFPVSGEGLPADVLYYGFEDNALEYQWKEDFTQIDVDKKSTYESNYYQTIIENDGGKYAFTWVTNNNVSMLAAHSGSHTICAAAPADNTAADDWLISKQLTPAEGATFDFYARNLGTENSVFIGDNDLHRVSVLVSETGNSSTSDFKVLMRETEMPYLKENEWNHYTVDLSPYAGKNIYVALRHTTVSANWLAFFDDLTFTHVGPADASGIEAVSLNGDTQLTVYTLDGVQVASGRGQQVLQQLGKGLYVVKTADGQALRVARK
ncbi:MAG: choice-of-anchor J domain-containing protein [Prevotella sp.]|nr:choice-of-anchor J domain-containing protein [Prevotella sp.]